MKLASFDIFDTTLLRRCGRAELVFRLTAQRLFPQDESLGEAFVIWRGQRTAETLVGIYDDPSRPFAPWHTPQEMMQAEKDTEAEMLVANPAVRQLITRKRQEGCTIAFISDMYLDSAFLREVLLREGCAEEGDAVFVSCEHHARKDTGTLYDLVRRQLSPEAWEHYGDNRRSDYLMARRKGIRAHWLPTDFNAVETATMRHASGTLRQPSRLQLLAGISRHHRLLAGADPYAAMAADFVAPTYLPYVAFVLQEARRRGIRRLYFLNRDGYVLMRAAQAMGDSYPDVELRYLFLSRRSLLMPYLRGGDDDTYLAACDHHTIVRVDSIDKRLLHLGTCRDELSRKFGIIFDYHKAGNLGEQTDFLQKIFHSDFTALLQERCEEAWQTATDYFRQEGLADGTPSAMVDVGWLGTTRLMMTRILQSMGAKPVETFYYGVRRDVLPPTAGSYTAYLGATLTTGATGLFENYYSASPYASTIGYERRGDGTVTPVLADAGKPSADRHIVEANVSAMEGMARELTAFRLTAPHLLCLWAREALRIITQGSEPFDLSPLLACSEFDSEPFVKRLSIRELLRSMLLGKTVSAFERMSYRATLSHRLLAPAWRLHEFTGRLRGILYRRYRAGR